MQTDFCRRSDALLFDNCDKKKKMVDHLCHAGLFEAVKPVIIDSQIVGYVMIGQVRIQSIIYTEHFDLWDRKYENYLLHDAYEKVPIYLEDKLSCIVDLFNSIVELIIHKRLIQLQEIEQFAPVMELLNQWPEKHVSLEQAAKMTHRSTSSFSHEFRKITGVTFRDFQIENRISKAEELLRSGGCQTVQETAYRCGFQNAFYFSRLFKKYRGYPPSQLLHSSGQHQ